MQSGGGAQQGGVAGAGGGHGRNTAASASASPTSSSSASHMGLDQQQLHQQHQRQVRVNNFFSEFYLCFWGRGGVSSGILFFSEVGLMFVILFWKWVSHKTSSSFFFVWCCSTLGLKWHEFACYVKDILFLVQLALRCQLLNYLSFGSRRNLKIFVWRREWFAFCKKEHFLCWKMY